MGFMSQPSMPPIDHLAGERYPLFTRVHLETSRFCNRKCAFCPVSTGRRDGPQEHIPDDVFDRVIGELADLKFDGVLQMFLLNEPLMSGRFPDHVSRARAALPEACVYVSTNGDWIVRGDDPAVHAERLAEVFGWGVTSINLNVYDSGEAGAERLRAYRRLVQLGRTSELWTEYSDKYAYKNPRRSWVHVTDMREDRVTSDMVDWFYDRSREDRARVTAPQIKCSRPSRGIVVIHTGEVLLCCALDPTDDPPHAPRVGDMRDPRQTLVGIWNDEQMRMYRYYLSQGRRVLPGCDTCNHRHAFMGIHRRVRATPEELERWERNLKDYERSRGPLGESKRDKTTWDRQV